MVRMLVEFFRCLLGRTDDVWVVPYTSGNAIGDVVEKVGSCGRQSSGERCNPCSYNDVDWIDVLHLLSLDKDKDFRPDGDVANGINLELLESVFANAFSPEKVESQKIELTVEGERVLPLPGQVEVDSVVYSPVRSKVILATSHGEISYGLPIPLGDIRNYIGKPSMSTMVRMYGMRENYVLKLRTDI